VLGAATILGAFGAYQSALWGGNCLTNYNKGAITMNQANSQMLLGVQLIMMDGILFIESVSQRFLGKNLEQPGRAKIADYLDKELMQDDFLVAYAWAQKTGEPPFDFPGYAVGTPEHTAIAAKIEGYKDKPIPSYEQMRLASALAMSKEGQKLFAQGQKDNSTGDAFTLVTVFFTVVLFFAGMASVLRRFSFKVAFLVFAVAMLALASARMFMLPFA